VSAGEGTKRLASNEVLGNLSFELDAVGAVLGHGFHPLKARQPRSIPNLHSVYRQEQSTYCLIENVTKRVAVGRLLTDQH
jgi:acetylglutamate synthase